MQTALVIALSLHVLSSVFWAGSSFALARTGAAGGEQLVGPQLGAATVAILTGGYLGHLVHSGSFGTAERVLALGAVCALIAAGIQAATGPRALLGLRRGTSEAADVRSRIATAQRVAAALLAITALCMGAARYI
jgi:large exoprotein involved in heme utilization and adhesion